MIKILKKTAAIILRVGISIILLAVVFMQVDKKNLWEIIKHADKPLLLLAALVFFSNYVLCLFRWEMLLKTAKIHLPLKRVIVSFCGGVFFSLFLPSTIGGDLVRSLDLAAHTKRPREVVATVLLDRLSGYTGLVILAIIAVIFGGGLIQHKSVIILLSVITAILVSILLVLFNKFIYAKINRLLHSPTAGRLREAIKNLHEELHIFRRHKKIMVNNLILSLLIQAVSPLTFYIIGLSLGIKLSIIYFFVFIPIIGAITLLPISIGGLGLRDNATVFFFAQAAVSGDRALAMSLLSFFFLVIYGALGGLFYVFGIHHRRIQPD